MKILITGCNGLIGSSLVEFLNKNSKDELFGLARHKNEAIKTFIVDLNSNWNTSELPVEMDVIVHLAQSEKFREFPASASEVFNVNTQSTLKLVDYARTAGVKKFIYASTGAVYGNATDEMTEQMRIEAIGNLGFYHTSKICSEVILDNFSSIMDIIILRFFFVYGVQQNKTMLIPRLINSVYNGHSITLQGEEGIKINPIYVDDAVNALVKCFSLSGSHKINIAGPEVITLKDLGILIGTQMGKEPIFQMQEDVKAHNFIGDTKKMSQLLVAPTISIKDGITKYINAVFKK